MTSLLFQLILASLLSITSLIVILLRVSPLTSPTQALPAFFVSMFLSITSIGTLCAFLSWRFFRADEWDEGKTLGISLRQGIFLGVATLLLLVFHLFGLLTWWVGILIYCIFLFVELALLS